jgi:hypothetical protein
MGRERLGNRGSGATFAKLTVDQMIAVKDDNGADAFEYWDKATSSKKYFKKSIEGILLGTANTIGVFDPGFGRNGGEYRSSYFLKNTNRIVIFDPTGEKAFTGTRDEIDSWAMTARIQPFKIKKHLFVLNDRGTIIDVATNMIIFIDQSKSFDKEAFKDYLLKLTPSHFRASENPINLSKKSLEYLGPFTEKNPAKYAFMEIGAPLTDELYEKYAADSAMDMYEAWEKSMGMGAEDLSTNVQQANEGQSDPAPQQRPGADANTKYGGKSENIPGTSLPPSDKFPEEDDLPFILTILLAVGSLVSMMI